MNFQIKQEITKPQAETMTQESRSVKKHTLSFAIGIELVFFLQVVDKWFVQTLLTALFKLLHCFFTASSLAFQVSVLILLVNCSLLFLLSWVYVTVKRTSVSLVECSPHFGVWYILLWPSCQVDGSRQSTRKHKHRFWQICAQSVKKIFFSVQ